jgi:hypothetical protein
MDYRTLTQDELADIMRTPQKVIDILNQVQKGISLEEFKDAQKKDSHHNLLSLLSAAAFLVANTRNTRLMLEPHNKGDIEAGAANAMKSLFCTLQTVISRESIDLTGLDVVDN